MHAEQRSKLRILLIHAVAGEAGGAETYFIGERKLLREEGYDVYSYAFAVGGGGNDRDYVFDETPNRTVRKIGKFIFEPRVYANLRKFVERAEYEAVVEDLLARLKAMKDPAQRRAAHPGREEARGALRRPQRGEPAGCLRGIPGPPVRRLHAGLRRARGVPGERLGQRHHRRNGLYIGAGPALAAGPEVEGLEIFDVAPNVLHLLGLPIPEHMDGRFRPELFAEGAEQGPRVEAFEDAAAATTGSPPTRRRTSRRSSGSGLPLGGFTAFSDRFTPFRTAPPNPGACRGLTRGRPPSILPGAMKNPIAVAFALAALPTVAFAAETAATATTAPVPIVPAGEIGIDPAITRGSLDNGLVYLVRENQRPKSRAQLRLVVKAGSIDEDEDQLGFAHFLEHMLFNGTESYPGNEIVEYLESIGARFGADLNAYTSFDETVYMLEIPTDRGGTARDRASRSSPSSPSRATIEAEEVERERGVVLDEWRRGLGAGSRIRDQQLPIVLKGSRYADRLPIGDPEILRSPGTRKPSGASTDDWYRPERMAVVAVGDFDAAEVVEAMIRARVRRRSRRRRTLRERREWDVPAQADTLWAIAEDDELRGNADRDSVRSARRRPEAADLG